MNALVRETEVETYLGLLGAAWEVWLLHDQLEPLPLRMELAPVFLELRRQTLGPGL